MKTRFNRTKRPILIITLALGVMFLLLNSKVSDTEKPKDTQVRNITTTQTLSGQWKLATDPGNKGRDEGWFNGIRPELALLREERHLSSLISLIC